MSSCTITCPASTGPASALDALTTGTPELIVVLPGAISNATPPIAINAIAAAATEKRRRCDERCVRFRANRSQRMARRPARSMSSSASSGNGSSSCFKMIDANVSVKVRALPSRMRAIQHRPPAIAGLASRGDRRFARRCRIRPDQLLPVWHETSSDQIRATGQRHRV